jgi:HSP90 family molecular chaperone
MKEQIPITIQNPSELLNLLSQGYGTLSRALMEYIDNSFDSADDFFNEYNQKYDRDVVITVNLDRNKKLVVIADNCVGMDKKNSQTTCK